MMLGVSHAQRPPRQRLSSNALVVTWMNSRQVERLTFPVESDSLRGICSCAAERDWLGGWVGVERVVGKDGGAGERADGLRLEAEAEIAGGACGQGEAAGAVLGCARAGDLDEVRPGDGKSGRIRYPQEQADLGVGTHIAYGGKNFGWLRDRVAVLLARRPQS